MAFSQLPLISDTPSDKTLWSCVSTGAYCNLLVAPEQFDPEGGPQTKQNQPFYQQKNSKNQAKSSPVLTRFSPKLTPQIKQNQPFRQQKNSEYQAKCSPVPTSKSQGQGSRQSRLRYDKQVKDKKRDSQDQDKEVKDKKRDTIGYVTIVKRRIRNTTDYDNIR
ncbi:hypothetical protein BD769DRAFT_1388874 [Suillus cothurnatus]|nr:hypothetical protein BD769DRAFT_1388874 [Suillus cothurnatus]